MAMTRRRPFARMLLASSALVIGAGGAFAQEGAPGAAGAGDTVIVVGSQIRGAQVTEALPVAVVGVEEIGAMSVTSGDELFRSIPQLGDVAFNTSRAIGSINDARGDTASINLRALGTGNTLVLLNGRRMVNHPGTQAENLVPVVTVNTNAIPVMGLQRVEVLLDGASALYGADAVAGVVNNVLKSDLDGFAAEIMVGQEDGVDATEFSGSFELGINSDDGRTNVSVFGSYFTRDPIFASERDFTANADHTYRAPADYQGTTFFRSDTLTSAWAGAEALNAAGVSTPVFVNGTRVTNASGAFHIQPNTLAGCLAQLGGGICIDDSSTRDAALRYNQNEEVTIQNGVDRANLFTFVNHELTDNLELFAEAGVYLADSVGYREAAPMLGAVDIVVPASNYYNPFGPVGSPNRLPGLVAPAEGYDVNLIAYRPIDAGPRKFEVENLATRVVAGLRGEAAGWDWETAFLYSKAETEDRANRVSNTLFQEALARSTPDAYNPFSGGCIDNLNSGDCTPSMAATIDDITVLVSRKSSTSLASWDAKISRPDLFSIWSGDIGMAAGVELRRETFQDNRDPRQDGTLTFTDMISGLTANDLQGNSESLDTRGSRNVGSAFVEFAVPLVSPEMNVPLAQSVDLQLAARYENFDEFGSVTKPKVALSWRPFDFLMFRSAWSEGFRAPNLQQQFETGLQRSNGRTDYIFCEAAERIDANTNYTTNCTAPAGLDPQASFLVSEASQSVISNRQGSLDLEPEESRNLTAGLVFEATFIPPEFGEVTFTADWWRVEQDDIVGIFGDDNQILLDYALRMQGSSNPAVVRDAPTAEQAAAFTAAGLDPVGEILFVNDNYLNLDSRKVEGVDLGVYYEIDGTALGDFSFRFNAAYLDKFFQEISGAGQQINAAIDAGLVPAALSVGGEGDLVRDFGRPEWRYSSSLTWRNGPWGAGWFTSYVGDVFDDFSPSPVDGSPYIIDTYQTHNLHVQYEFGHDTDRPLRLRVGMRNAFDETPPLAATSFGYLGELHNPSGRFVYGSIRKTF